MTNNLRGIWHHEWVQSKQSLQAPAPFSPQATLDPIASFTGLSHPAPLGSRSAR